MSATDKTRPIWVQIKDPDNRGWIKECHDHRSGPCDLGDPQHESSYASYYWRWSHRLIHRSSCFYEHSSTAYYGGIYGRRPRKRGWGRMHREGRARMFLRQIKQEYRKTLRQDWDTVDHLWMHPGERQLWFKWRD